MVLAVWQQMQMVRPFPFWNMHVHYMLPPAMPYWPLLLLVLTTTLCRSDPVDQLCCLGGPLGSSLGIPQIGLDGSGCPVDPYATSVAVAVDANDTYIQGIQVLLPDVLTEP